MRLFITDFSKNSEDICIDENRVLKHIKVLRLKAGDTISVQDVSCSIRHTCEITEVNNDSIKANIILTQKNDTQASSVTMIICTPNSSDKLHTIVQKLSEIGVSEILFWHSERSQGMKVNEKKIEKLKKISLEAVEQSNGWVLPHISTITHIENCTQDKTIVLFDQTGNAEISKKSHGSLCGIIGPEGGFSQDELDYLESYISIKVSLGNTILRTETAAIVGGWIMKQESRI